LGQPPAKAGYELWVKVNTGGTIPQVAKLILEEIILPKKLCYQCLLKIELYSSRSPAGFGVIAGENLV
jgi:hypothetical protein